MIKFFVAPPSPSAAPVYERLVTHKGVCVFGITYQSPRLRALYERTCSRGARGRRTDNPQMVHIAINPTDLGTAVVLHPDGFAEIVASSYPGAHGLNLSEQRTALRAARAYGSKPSFELLLLRNRKCLTQRRRLGRMISHRSERRLNSCSAGPKR
ncbi:Mu transposase C-terminal domain-containing protein [Microvirga sesbaniae]|uniref:Mu transposase C-terminal domain-containing protein n=1 Tax=Microvirga sesbaniae TaxID=681392 RepID=UPI00358DA8F7